MSNVAAIDIGSNSVRLLITNGSGEQLEREMRITRLAQDVDRGGCLVPAAIARTIGVLTDYGRLIAKHGVSATRVTATSAARDAHNREEFFEQVARAVGTAPELLSGHDEATLAFLGATGGHLTKERQVTLDIGGGSTEIACGTAVRVEACHSVNMGCVRVTERFLSEDPPNSEELSNARAFIVDLLRELERHVPCPASSQWIGLAGTVTSLAAWDAGLGEYTPSVTHGYRLEARRVSEMVDRLCRASLAERQAWLLEPQRASVVVGGGLILEETMKHFDLDAIQVSERDILDGLAASLRAARNSNA